MAASVREAILLMLAGATLALLVGPCAYFVNVRPLPSVASMYRTESHYRGSCKNNGSSAETCLAPMAVGHDAPEVTGLTRRDYIRETVFGGLDGLLTMVAVMLGGIGADLSAQHIFAMGMSNLLADAFSMGFGEYVAASAEREFATAQEAMEYREVEEFPEQEILEMVKTYTKHGISEDDAMEVANRLSKYKDFWIQHMLWEELKVKSPKDMNSPVVSGAIVFFSFTFFGMIPLLGVALPLALRKYAGAEWFRPELSSIAALAISALTLLLMGTVLGIYIGSESVISSAVLMLLNGCFASGISFSLSQYFFASDGLGGTPVMSQQDPDVSPSQPQEVAAASAKDGRKRIQLAWPFFRRRFARGLFLLWLVLSTVVVVHGLMSHMVYESFRVLLYGLATCITTGLGVLPLLIVSHSSVNEAWLAAANSVSGGMMLAASAGMLREAHESSGRGDWQLIVGLVLGVLFIKASQLSLGSEEDAGMEALCGAVMERRHFKRAVLIFTVMFCHSAAEGVAVGVAFDRNCKETFGVYVSLLLAIQNIPEGTAVALVLVPRGIDIPLATVIATLTSIPQPLMAVAAFRFVETFQSLLPIGLAFAAGAMVYVSVCDLLTEALEALGGRRVLGFTTASFTLMFMVQVALEGATAR
eukprot:gnl/TRDRNA2_/TRDRNA2_143077_c0_seq1.p1 gnl/TRDRNA2_/TRDRNA2_143077_c0~~gnl/TRDRNA2_/TRDRNA2_143077_c0_seq1.p1  ORF type:complete len:645 (+),score=107.57 gnl/TRDRNA2_/TRDRNA2_143077_c0_seq1:53-1987(+)